MATQNFQIFIHAPELQVPIYSLTVSPNQTLGNLKSSLFSSFSVGTKTLDSFFFALNGKPLSDSCKLSDCGVSPFSTLISRARVLGGGGDGGATGAESRDCYLNMYASKKPDKVDPNETRLSKWSTCALSYEPLKPPCVIDKLGNIFNKETLVEALLGKKIPKQFGHIKGLKDMITIHLSSIPGIEMDDISFGTKFQCPITGLEFNGKYKFFALRSCGHVLSAKALKEVQSDACLVCHSEFSESEKIVINGSEDEVANLREKLEAERAKGREKKEKKRQNGDCVFRVVDSGLQSQDQGNVDSVKSIKGLVGSYNPVSSLTLSKRKRDGNEKISISDPKKEPKDLVKRSKAGVIPPRHTTTEVYASIFTSSKKSDFKETYMCRSLPLGRN
ncbi:hypothetical protein AMTRI_Chr12g272910 [Amborella trichopoda]